MDEGSALTLFFLQIWRFFTLESPFFGLTFAEITIGLFVCELGIGIFASFFVGLFDVSAPGAQANFKETYNNSIWRERYRRFYK